MVEEAIDEGPEDQKNCHHQKVLFEEDLYIERFILVKEKGTADHQKERNPDPGQGIYYVSPDELRRRGRILYYKGCADMGHQHSDDCDCLDQIQASIPAFFLCHFHLQKATVE